MDEVTYPRLVLTKLGWVVQIKPKVNLPGVYTGRSPALTAIRSYEIKSAAVREQKALKRRASTKDS